VVTSERSGRLAGRAVVVTGAAGGIGAAIARRVGAEGATVACVDLDLAGAQATAEALPDAFAIGCDLTGFAAVEALAAEVVDRVGTPWGLVTAAGGSRAETVPFLELDPATWQRMIDRNLTATFNCGLVFARLMAAEGQGSIVLVSSQLSTVVRPHYAHYVSAKGGVAQLTRAMAVDLADSGIRVNAVAPGPTRTPGNAAWFERPEVVELHHRTVPMRRVAEADEIAGAAVYLLSDEATYTTASTITVDGGYTAV
jgi:NAD(P)-dependent dehydrogenase (short-subunit alcohol dehydrogenase family)